MDCIGFVESVQLSLLSISTFHFHSVSNHCLLPSSVVIIVAKASAYNKQDSGYHLYSVSLLTGCAYLLFVAVAVVVVVVDVIVVVISGHPDLYGTQR